MSGATHRIGGICAGILLVKVLPEQSVEKDILFVFGCVFGSLFPDIDHPNSRLSHKLPLLFLAARAGQKLLRGLSGMVPGKTGKRIHKMAGHRGLTHSLLFSGIFCAAGWCGGSLTLGMAFGILSHLAFDMISGGVPLLLPFYSGRIGVRLIVTGSIPDTILIRTVLISCCIWQLILKIG